MEEKNINQTIIETLRGVAVEFGKTSSPTAGVDTKGKSKKGAGRDHIFGPEHLYI